EPPRRLRAPGLSGDVVFVTRQPEEDDGVEAMKLGAFHYLRKPVEPALIEDTLRRAVDQLRLRRENAAWRRLHGPESLSNFIGDSPAIRAVLEVAKQAGPRDSRVVLLGESGSGQGLLAQ